MEIINHQFKVKYIKPTKMFEWKDKNSIVGYESYKSRIIPKLNDIAIELYYKTHSRQAVVIVNEELNHMSCLLSLQFQVSQNTLYLTANYRSMCEKWGLPNDKEFLCYIAYLMIQTSTFRSITNISDINIHVNVGNYHINKNGKDIY